MKKNVRLLALLLALLAAALAVLAMVLLVVHKRPAATADGSTPSFRSIYPDPKTVDHPPMALANVPDAVSKIGGDALYLVLLQRDNALVVNEPTVTITLGHRLCDYRATGHSTEDTITALMASSHMANGDAVTFDAATLLVTAAEQALCPQYQ